MRTLDRKQLGFTLVEIIAVLVILGILAAVAVPKYYDLQKDAQNKAAQAVAAEAMARFNMLFGKALLRSTTGCEAAKTAAKEDVVKADHAKYGDGWTVTWDFTADPYKVTANKGDGGADGSFIGKMAAPLCGGSSED